VENSELPFPIS